MSRALSTITDRSLNPVFDHLLGSVLQVAYHTESGYCWLQPYPVLWWSGMCTRPHLLAPHSKWSGLALQMCIWGKMLQVLGLEVLVPLLGTAVTGSLRILLFITVWLKDLLVIFPPLKDRRAQFGVGHVQASEYGCFSRLHLQSLWGRQDQWPVW